MFNIQSPTPSLSFDADFSRMLEEKREEQLEASRLKSFDCDTSKFADITNTHNTTDVKSKSVDQIIFAKPTTKTTTATATATPASKAMNTIATAPPTLSKPIDLENSMFFGSAATSKHDLSDSDDSFLEMERQCNMEEQREQIINANETCLFDIEPPSELFNKTVDQSYLLPMPQSPDADDSDTIELSPCKYIGLIRPSTIIEETSSQLDSSSKIFEVSASSTQSMSESSKFDTAESSGLSIDNTAESLSHSCDSVKSLKNRSRRETFAFKRKNYTFFGNEKNLEPIDESNTSDNSENDTIEKDGDDDDDKHDTSITSDKHNRDQFNDTIEAVDYFLEEGRKMIEQTPVANRDAFQRSVLETPLFSCKRKRIMSEMANEMMPLPKRGPLIDFSTPEPENKTRMKKFLD